MQFEENLKVSVEGLLSHRLRSLLTMSGIIFGVAAVIAMLSIGEGAKFEAIRKYQELGISNIIVREKDLTEKELLAVRARFSSGLSIQDAKAIEAVIPGVKSVCPQAEKKILARSGDNSTKATLVGITPNFENILNYSLQAGHFIREEQCQRSLKVCILGAQIARTLFPTGDVLNQLVKLDDQWFAVIGVMSNKMLFTETIGELAARDLNYDVYIPLTTFLNRFPPENEFSSQIRQITIQTNELTHLLNTANVVRRILHRRHYQNSDYSIIIPYELLKQEAKERQTYNVLLGCIAAISLLVGGIGIMNIMLATVSERIREIGIRRAIGASRSEILYQFLTEAVTMAIVGGTIGVIVGISMSLIIGWVTNYRTVVTLYSIFLAFFVSGIIGVVFGFLPAKKAASLNPIDSLRFE